MAGEYVVIRSEVINTREEARVYYDERLSGAHPLVCYGKRVSVYFPLGYTHFYSQEPAGAPLDAAAIIQQRVRGGATETRMFSLQRARLMDKIVPAVVSHAFTIPGRHRNRAVYGPRLSSGEYMCVVVRPTEQPENWTAVSAYPVDAAAWRTARAAKNAKFPY